MNLKVNTKIKVNNKKIVIINMTMLSDHCRSRHQSTYHLTLHVSLSVYNTGYSRYSILFRNIVNKQ